MSCKVTILGYLDKNTQSLRIENTFKVLCPAARQRYRKAELFRAVTKWQSL